MRGSGEPLWPSQEAKKRKQRERARNVIFDPLKLDEENGAYVQAERVAPGSGDAMRKRDAGIAWTASRYGVPENDVRARWQLYKADMGGKWGTGVLDDDAFHARAKQEQQDEDARLETLMSAQEAAFQAALEGRPMLEALNAWQGLEQGPQPKGKLDATPAFMGTFSRVGDVLRPYKPLVKAAPEAMRRTMQGAANEKDAETLERLAWTVADAQGDERQLLISALAAGVRRVAEAGGERGVGGTFTGASARLLESMFGPQFESIADVNPKRLAFQGPIDSPEAAQKAVSEELRIRASERMQGALAVEAAGLIPAEGTRELTPEESALVQAQIERRKKFIATGRELKRLALESDPLRSDWLGTMASGTASTMTLALPLAFGGWGTFSAAAGYTKMEAEELLTEHPEMSGEDALMVGALSGSIQAALDKASLFGLGKFSPNLRKLLTGQGSKELVKRAALETGAVLTFENAVEGLQDIATPTVQAIVAEMRETVPQVNWDEEWQRWKDTRADVFIGMLPLIMLGAGVRTVRNKSHVEAILRNDRDLARAGVVEADRVTISEQLQTGDVDGATATLEEAWERRSPELAAEMGNEQEAEMIQVVRAIQAAEQAGMIPTIRRDAQGWTVESRDGSQVRVSTREEAVQMAYSALSDYERQEAEATAQLADEFMGMGEGRAEAFEISRQGASVQSEVEAGRQTPEGAALQVEVFAQIHGLSAEEARAERLSVLGSNRMEMIEGVRTAVSRVFGGGNLLTALHEGVHGRWNAGLASGHYTHAQGLLWVRMAEQASGVEFLPTREDAAVTPAMLDEAIVDVVQADVLGRRKDGKQHFTPGLISRGVASFALAQRAEAKQAGRLATFLKAWREFWGRVLRAGRAMARARKEGKLGDDFDVFLDDLLGAEPQQRHEAAAAREAVDMAAEIDPDNVPFSLAPFGPQVRMIREKDVPPVVSGSADPFADVADDGTLSVWNKAWKAWEKKHRSTWRGTVETLDGPIQISGKTDEEMRKLAKGEDAHLHYEAATHLSELLTNSVLAAVEPEVKGKADVAEVHRRYAWMRFADGKTRSVLLTVFRWDASTKRDFDTAYSEEVLLEVQPRPVLVPSVSSATSRATEDTGEAAKQVAAFTAGIKPEHRWRGASFSLAPRSLASVADTVLAAKMRKPEFRELYMTLARERLAKLRQDGSWRVDRLGRASRREGMDSMAGRIRAPGNIEAERKFRLRSRQRELTEQGMAGLTRETLEAYAEGLTTIEADPLVAEMLSRGRLMSKTAAEKAGKLKTDGKGNAGDYDGAPWMPPAWYAGGAQGYMPDQMAQELFEAGLLNEATPDALWAALDTSIKSARAQNESVRQAQAAVRKVEREAEAQARAETDAWAKEERARVPTAKERQMAALRTLDAILSAFPPEIRGRVGGFVKLASLGTDAAREKEIVRRLDKLDEVLEKEARKHYRERIDALFERAKPKKGKPGEKPKGKIGSQAQELVDMASAFAKLDEAGVSAERAAIEDRMQKEEDPAKLADLFEREQLLDLFGALDERTAAELEAAAEWLSDTYKAGRNLWRAVIEAREQDAAENRRQARADIGKQGAARKLLLKGPSRVGLGRGAETGCEGVWLLGNCF